MKKLFFLLTSSLCIVLPAAFGQVLSFSPIYAIYTGYSNNMGRHYYDRVEEFKGNIVVDLAKKTVTKPGTYGNEADAIDNVRYDADTKTYILKMERRKSEYTDWERYYLPLGEDGQPRYIRKATHHKGHHYARDTFFETYTKTATEIQLENTFNKFATSGRLAAQDSTALTKAMSALYFTMPSDQHNVFEIMDGGIRWTATDADGKDQVYYLKNIVGQYMKYSSFKGINWTCIMDGTPRRYFEIFYGRSGYFLKNGNSEQIGIIMTEKRNAKDAESISLYW